MPLPLVTKPIISSPGTGLQHLEKRTETSWIPLTVIPDLLRAFSTAFVLFFSSISLSASWSVRFFRFSLSYSSTSLLITWPSFNPPCPIAARMESQFFSPYLCIHFSWYSGFIYLDITSPLALQ